MNRKLLAAKAELSAIKSKQSDVRNQFLKSEAERVGEEYATLTAKLVVKFEQLVALDKLLGQSAKLRVNNYDKFFVPIFNVKACHGKGTKTSMGNSGQSEMLLIPKGVLRLIRQSKAGLQAWE